MYVRTQELEWILTNYRELAAIRQELEIEAEAVANEGKDDDAIYGLVLKRSVDWMPHTKKISDRTATAALNIHELSRECMTALKEIKNDMLLVGLMLDKLAIALRVLKPLERKIIELKLFQVLTWSEIANNTTYSTRSVQGMYKSALEKTLRICRISLDEYQDVRALLERM
jgi:DNA-directed RNA polymerase specialized sigma24 family protein